jgi:hypothetical protein
VDFIVACQEWVGYDETSWWMGYAKFSDGCFFLHYGVEMPKYRIGHMWWLGFTSTHGRFGSTINTTYENEYYQSPKPGS